MPDSGRVDWKKPLDMDSYKRLYEGWKMGSVRNTHETNDFTITVPPTGYHEDFIDLSMDPPNQHRLIVRVIVLRES